MPKGKTLFNHFVARLVIEGSIFCYRHDLHTSIVDGVFIFIIGRRGVSIVACHAVVRGS